MQVRLKLSFSVQIKHLNFKISVQKKKTVKQNKYLGIYLDEHLTWNFQLDQIKTKLSRSCDKIKVLYYQSRLFKIYVFYNFWLNLKIYKFGISIGIKQLKKLNKFKKRPLELRFSNQEMNLPIVEDNKIQRHSCL